MRRYGFHGLSHAWIARRAPELLGRDAAELRIVSCHLGAGASLCAIAGGRSVDTTMGFTPLEGLVMATRSGSVDPGLLLWLLEQTGMTERELAARARARVRPARAWPAPPTCARSSRGPARGDADAGSRSTSTCTGCAPASPRWPPRSAGSTRSCSPAASASTRAEIRALRPPPGLGLPRRRGRRRPQRRRAPATPRSAPPARADADARDRARARTSRSPARSAPSWPALFASRDAIGVDEALGAGCDERSERDPQFVRRPFPE